MNLKDGMLLYHGSYTTVKAIDLNMCAAGKDFGKGFYLTSDPQQARDFVMSSVAKAHMRGLISQSQDYGFVTSFRYHESSEKLKIHTFPNANKEWLWFIAQNRRRQLAAILDTNHSKIVGSDIIVGKVANDQTNPVITAYLNGLYGDITSDDAIQDTIKRLLPDHLVDQFCFLTERSLTTLEFVEAIKYVR